ncbi:heterokaryon incompatibility protein-domain-containing protein [Hypoxylon trugodes]|uniref:heterokaryon incompatibility protein-domain-containing protein n=1 Tax=Hypoxylon trugodes TaxID=326681 RepID=UPI00218F89C8|nr:heterokaryon incompatibility protein-domain-containing protein [Hypoxylon trugodes]KAI1392063.1 heterokaryon incompatibility protein-domain-containing protein [Hypoxylon trugodes]
MMASSSDPAISMVGTRPEYWAMEYLDHKIGHGLFEVQPDRRVQPLPGPTESPELPTEECAICHRPRDGHFTGVVGDLKSGMSRGCRLCDALHQIIVAITREPYQVSHPFRLEIRRDSPAILDICVATVMVGEVYEPVFAKYQVYFQTNATRRPQSLSAFDSIGFGSPVASTAHSIKCMSFAKAALDQCIQKHHDCGQSDTNPILPTRVLDLGENDSSIKLLEPAPGTRAQYVALSHCWGANAKRLETKQARLEDFKSSIPWPDLPPTFQDAVTVTRCLGIRYLWIDSLCIIQDSASDWEIESSRMAAVYRDASVTVAAVSSSSSDEHFLKPRNKVYQEQLLLLGLSRTEQQLSAEELGIVAPDVNTEPIFALGIRPLAVHTTSGPLSDRAWTFQEEKLSSRILRFSETELSFECRRGIACECDMHGAAYNNSLEPPQLPPLHGLAAAINNTTGSEGNSADRLHQLPPHLDPFLAWQNRVSEYSQRNITFASDKLPALAGLATICHAITKSTYLAGLWRDHFVLDLLWHPAGHRSLDPEQSDRYINCDTAKWKPGLSIPSENLPDAPDLGVCYTKKLTKIAAHTNLLALDIPSALPSKSKLKTRVPIGFVKDYRAPTFSWVSIDCPIAFRSPPLQTDIIIETEVIDAQCTINGLNPFGRVSDGYALLKGPLVEVRISTRPLRRNYGSYILKRCDAAVSFTPDLPLALDSLEAPNSSDSRGTGSRDRVRRATAADGVRPAFRDVPVWCLSLLRSKDGLVREVMVLGLSSRVPGAYERLGLIDTSAPRTLESLNCWFESEEEISLTEVKCV